MSAPTLPRPIAPPPRRDGIPADLTAEPAWVLWRYEWREGKGERPGAWTKVPYAPSGRGRASSTDPSTWGALEEAWDILGQGGFDGVGFVFDPARGFFGVDLDAKEGGERGPVFNPDGDLAPWAAEIVGALETYAERSVGGAGLHIIGRGKLPEGRRRAGPLEMYDAGRFFTVTGDALPGRPAEVRDVGAALAFVHRAAFTPSAPIPPERAPAPLGQLALSDAEVIERAFGAQNGAAVRALYTCGVSGYPSPSEARAALLMHLAFWTGGDAGQMERLLRASALADPKLDTMRGEATFAAYEVARALERWGGEAYDPARRGDRPAPLAGRRPWKYDEAPPPAGSADGGVASPALPALEWCPFPVDVFPQAGADYARAHAAAIGCDVAFVAAPMLAVLGMAVGNSHGVAIKCAWREGSPIWVGTVGESGSGKSPALDAAALPVFQLESEARRENEAARAEYEAAVERRNALGRAEKAKTPAPAKPERRRVRTSEPTLESLVLLLADTPRGIGVVRDELGGWLAGMNQYKRDGADVQGYLEVWGCRPVVIDRKTGDHPVIYAENPNASVAGGIQPGILRGRLSAEMLESGFLARLLLVEPPERPLPFTDADVSPEVRHAYCDLVRGMYARLEGSGDLPLSSEARAVFAAFMSENAGRYAALSGPLRSALVKLGSYAARFALVLHVADTAPGRTPGPISGDAMRRGVRLALWFRREAARLYQAYGFATSAAPLDRDARLCAALADPFTWRDVAAGWGVQRQAAYKVIARLTERSLVRQDEHGAYRRATGDISDNGDNPGVLDFPLAPPDVAPADPGGDGLPADPAAVALAVVPPPLEPPHPLVGLTVDTPKGLAKVKRVSPGSVWVEIIGREGHEEWVDPKDVAAPF
jgi:hypothetical protein